MRELEQIVKLVSELGDGARYAFYAWLAAEAFDAVLVALVMGTAMTLIYRAVRATATGKWEWPNS